MNKLAIPAILAATVMVAGIFAFMPVEQASTVHIQIQEGTVGLGCASEAVTLLADPNDDGLEFTFTGEASPMLIKRITVVATANVAAGETIALVRTSAQGDVPLVDGAILEVGGSTANIDDDPGIEVFNDWEISFLYVEDDAEFFISDTGAPNGAGDVFTFEFCGYVSDPANFDGDDISSTVNAVAGGG